MRASYSIEQMIIWQCKVDQFNPNPTVCQTETCNLSYWSHMWSMPARLKCPLEVSGA